MIYVVEDLQTEYYKMYKIYLKLLITFNWQHIGRDKTNRQDNPHDQTLEDSTNMTTNY